MKEGDSDGVLREEESRYELFVGNREGGEICDERGGAGVGMTGDEVAEPKRRISTSVIGHPGTHILHQCPSRRILASAEMSHENTSANCSGWDTDSELLTKHWVLLVYMNMWVCAFALLRCV